MSRTYIRATCPYCGKEISTAGVATYNHYRMHERQGLLTIKVEDIELPYVYEPTLKGLIAMQIIRKHKLSEKI